MSEKKHEAYDILISAARDASTEAPRPKPINRPAADVGAVTLEDVMPDAPRTLFRLVLAAVFLGACMVFFLSIYRMSVGGSSPREGAPVRPLSNPTAARPLDGDVAPSASTYDGSHAPRTPTPLPARHDPIFDQSGAGPGPVEI